MKAKDLPSRPRPSGQPVPILRKRLSAPIWLLSLCGWQRRFSVATFVLVVGMLAVYGWTAYSQQKWFQAYRKLETLKSQERQLTTTNEVLKNKIAEQAEKPIMGLVPPNPSEAIFLVPTSQRLNQAAVTVPATTKLAPQTEQSAPSAARTILPASPAPIPLGY